MKKNVVVLGSIALLALMLVASACGGDDDKKSSTPAAGATTAATKPAANATSAATKSSGGSGAQPTPRDQVDALTVTAKDFSFALNLTSVHPGLPGVDVNFVNSGSTSHTVAFYKDADFKTKIAESQPVAAGASSGFPFVPPDGASSVFYRCEIHPTQMKGELAVK